MNSAALPNSDLAGQIHRLEIATNRAVEEISAGTYRSVFRGRGMEFDEVREYTDLDDVRDIDWNVTARNGGKAYVRKYVEERELQILLAVDVSASGRFGSGTISKRRSAAELAALLAFCAGRNGDKVGLLMFSDAIELYVPPRSGRRHALRLIREILAFESRSPRTDIAGALREIPNLLKHRGVVFLFSDLIDEHDFEADLKILNRRHDVVAVRFFDPLERVWQCKRPVTVEDAESGETVDFSGNDKKLNLELELAATESREVCRRAKVDLLEIATGSDVLKDLIEFFRRRKKRLNR